MMFSNIFTHSQICFDQIHLQPLCTITTTTTHFPLILKPHSVEWNTCIQVIFLPPLTWALLVNVPNPSVLGLGGGLGGNAGGIGEISILSSASNFLPTPPSCPSWFPSSSFCRWHVQLGGGILVTWPSFGEACTCTLTGWTWLAKLK